MAIPGSGSISQVNSKASNLINTTPSQLPGGLNSQEGRDFAQEALNNADSALQKKIFDPEVPILNRDALISEHFLASSGIDGLDFRKIYPYSFSIVNIKTGFCKIIFLPLPPTSFTFDIPNATQLTTTLNGIIEESNGAPLRYINISGTTGIVNKSTKVYGEPSKGSESSNLFSTVGNYATRFGGGNTMGSAQSAARNVTASASKALNAFGIDSEFYPLNNDDDAVKKYTGFYWFHCLLRFFEYYLHIKKTNSGKDVWLDFHVWKDGKSFNCTLNSFRWQKIPGSLEYNYTINLTAWGSINFDKKWKKVLLSFTNPIYKKQNEFDLFSSIKAVISLARTAVSSYKNIISSANMDVYENVIAPLNQINLLVKDVTGDSKKASDFPQLISSSTSTGLANAVSNAIEQNWDTYSTVINKISNNNYNYGDQSQSSSSLYSKESQSKKTNKSQKSILPEDFKKNPIKYSEVLDLIDINSLNLDENASSSIESEILKSRNLTLYDLVNYRNKISSFSKNFSDSINKNKKINTLFVQLSSQLNNSIIAIDQLIAFYKNKPKDSTNDYYSYYADYAVSNGLAFDKAKSKFFVPFPVDATLESLAQQYLNDPNRWIEIASLNGLKAPYIDEEGFTIDLKSNGNQSTALLSSSSNLYVGQVVTIYSDTQKPKKIKITEITEFSKSEFLISFDDNVDLSLYKKSDNAKIQAYYPNTVNSSMLIAIPSDQAPLNENQINIGPGLDQLSSIAQLSKIDFLLNSSGDLCVLPNGDIKRSIGYTNLIQAAKIKLLTQQGSMLHRPYFGNPLQMGISISGFDSKKYLSQLTSVFSTDERFTGILLSNINVRGPSVDVNLLIGTKNTDVNLPVTTTLPIVNL